MKRYLPIGLSVLALVGVAFLLVSSPSEAPARVGSLASPVINSSYLQVNGVRQEFRYQSVMATATTTVCSIQVPSATSTLQSFAADFTTGTSSDAHVQIGYGVNTNATTTLLAQAYLPGGNVGNQIIATTSLANGPVFAPNQWINVKMATVVGVESTGTFSPTGSCRASFTVADY